MLDIYLGGNSEYLQKTGTWHAEDSPWKASQIHAMLQRHNIFPQSVVEIGCGAGKILSHLYDRLDVPHLQFEGYDIAENAISLAQEIGSPYVDFYHDDFLKTDKSGYDLLLMIDVFEHVKDYIGFIEEAGTRATYKIYHIPLDMNLSSLVRNKVMDARNAVGHLHYFSKDTALATLRDAGQEVVDYFYTSGALNTQHKTLQTKIANIPRRLMFNLHPDWVVKITGGYSLMVLTK